MSIGEVITGLRLDPPPNQNFVVMMWETSSTGATIKSLAMSLAGDVLFGGFSEVKGLDLVQADHKQHEGGRNDTELRFPTRITQSNLTLTRGVSRISQSGWDWLYGFGEGKAKRMDGFVMLMAPIFGVARFAPHNLWWFKRAFPVKFTGPALNAAGKEVAIESLELAHDGLSQFSLLKSAAGLVGVEV